MSVWDTPYYLLEAAQAAYQSCGTSIVSTELFLTLVDHNITPAVTYNHKWPLGNLAETCRQDRNVLSQLWDRDHVGTEHALLSFFQQMSPTHVYNGFEGMCKLASHCASTDLFLEDDRMSDVPMKVVDTIVRIQAIGTYQSDKQIAGVVAKLSKRHKMSDTMSRLRRAADQFRHILILDRTSSAQQAMRAAKREGTMYYELPKKCIRIKRSWSIYPFKRMIVFRKVRNGRDMLYVFTRKQMERLARQCESLANVVEYMASYNNLHPDENKAMFDAFIRYFDELMRAMSVTPGLMSNWVCRSFDVVYNMYLAELLSDISTRAMDDQAAKFKRENLGTIVDAKLVLSAVDLLPVTDALEVLKVYKVMQPADSDQWLGFDRTRLLHRNPNVPGDHHLVATKEFASYNCFWLYDRWTFICAYQRQTGRCPGLVTNPNDRRKWRAIYPMCRGEDIPYKETGEIDLFGVMPYADRGIDYVDMLKDKRMCPIDARSRPTEYEMNRAPVEKTSYVIGGLTDITSVEANLLHMQRGSVDQVVAFKPESKKALEKARCFFSATMPARKAGAHIEAQIEDILKYKVGSLSGRSAAESLMAVRGITGFDRNEPNALIISFDIDAMSPTWSASVRERQYELWAEVMGDMNVSNVINLEKDAMLHFHKMGVNVKVRSEGVDFEGQHGKANTWFHASLMGYAVRIMREMGILEKGARFVCQIDDGLLRITKTTSWEPDEVEEVRGIIDEIYRMGGWMISWDKTFMSTLGGTYLNEVYYMGNKIVTGVKAYLRITTKKRQATDSITMQIGMLEGFTMGAFKSGASGLSTYRKFVTECLRSVRNHDVTANMLSPTFPWWVLSPVAVGGLGVRSLLTMSATVSDNIVMETLAMFETFERLVPTSSGITDKVFDPGIFRPLKARDMRNPQGVFTTVRKLGVTRIQRLVKNSVMPKLKHPFIKSVTGFAEHQYLEWLWKLHQVGTDNRIIEGMWAMSPFAAHDELCSKLKNETILEEMVPYRDYNRATAMVRYEVRHVLKQFTQRVR